MNKTPRAIRPILTQTMRALSGAETFGAELELSHFAAGIIAAKLYDLGGRAADPAAVPPVLAIQGKQPAYAEAKAAHAIARAALKSALANGRAFCAQAVDTLKGPLGRRWNQNWQAVGFTSGSLALPTDPVATLAFLAAHYRSHSVHETPALNLTAAKAELARTAIVTARAAVDNARADETLAKQARDKALADVRTCLAGLRDELAGLLSPDDARWYRFGFRRPVDGETPDLVDQVQLRPGGVGEVIAEWSRARLADNYRVSWIVTGSSGVATQVGIFTNQQAVLTGLPHPANITVMITARNSAGESAPMEMKITLA